MKIAFNIAILILLIMMLSINGVVYGSGYTTNYVTASEWDTLYSSYDGWTAIVHQDTASQSSATTCDYEYRCGSSSGKWRILTPIMRFDVSSLPDINEIQSLYVRVKISAMNSYGDPDFPAPWLALVLTQNESTGNNLIQSNMLDTWIDGITKTRVSNWYNWADYEVDDYLDFEILTDRITDVLNGSGEFGGTWTYLQVVSQYQYNDVAPGTWASLDGYEWYLSGMTPRLYYVYAEEPERPEFDYGTNAGYETTVTGDEVADNITLRTLSCMYADEDLGFTVYGDSGAVISLSLVDSDGDTLATHDDEIRTNGCYYWQIDTLSSDYSGFVRAVESNFNIKSPWVSVLPSPDSSQSNLKTYSRYTTYPQYENDFSDYCVYTGDYMYIHWKTNIDGSTESDDHKLELYINGDNVTPAYSANFTWLGENYYKGESDNWQDGIGWRYAIFTPKAIEGTDLYGGLINDLRLDYVPANKGFIQPVIYKVSESAELGETHTAYWYLEDACDGIDVSLQNNILETDTRVNVRVDVGRECKASTYLSMAHVEIVGHGSGVYGTIEDGTNWFSLDGLSNEGNYDVRVSLYDDSMHTYTYVYQLPLVVAGEGELLIDDTGPGGIWDTFMTFLGARGLDTELGHWIVILIAMVALFLIAYRSPLLRVALPLMVLGAGFISGWLDRWLIILLALGGGLALWGIFRKKTTGQGEG